MSQPIRKKVLEKNPELEKKPFYTLLVDGNGLLNVSFADTTLNSDGEHYGAVYQFLNQLRIMFTKKDFDYVYVFFDGHKSGLFRYMLYNGYKANRDKNYESMADDEELSEYAKALNAKIKKMQDYYFNKDKKPKEKNDWEKFVDANFARERDILLKYFNELYIRWVFDDEDPTEGDDYIAYYVENKKPEERIVIMTTDHDLTQLINDSVCVYDLKDKKFISKDNIQRLRNICPENVVVEKVFCGDKSDNIKNIEGVSENRLHEIFPEIKERPITVEEVIERVKEKINERINQKKKPLKWHENIVNGVTKGEYDGDFYEINKKLIDLSNPLISEYAKCEMDETMYNVQDPEGRSYKNLYQYIVEDKIEKLINEDVFAMFFEPFKCLTNKEIARYKKEINK